MSSTGELSCTYACLILHDDGIPITGEKIGTLVRASNLQVESYSPSLFAKLCEKKNVNELIMNVGIGGSAASTGTAVAAAPPATDDVAPADADKKKEEAKEESDDEAMFSLFD